MKGARGFTLIELLVVIAVMAVLMAILLPALGMARMHAKRVASAGNLRQIGLALELYTQDHRGFFPESSHGLTGQEACRRSWIFTLSPYLGDVNAVRVCPADPKRQERLAHPTSSYVLNEYIVVDAVNPFGQVSEPSYRNRYRLARSAATVTTFIGADALPAALASDHTHSRLWFLPPPNVPWDTLRKDIQPDRFRGREAADNTVGSSLYLYTDARVENLQARTVKEMADRGQDFSKPPCR